jgi:hypothetical protein
MGECNPDEEKPCAQQWGSDYQCGRVAPVVFTLKDGGNGERRRERRESPAESSDDHLSNVSVDGTYELVRDESRDAAANRVRSDCGPRSVSRVVTTYRVLAEIANHTAHCTEERGEKESHRWRSSPSHAARTPLTRAPATTAKHPPTQTCQIAARST